MGLDNGIAVRFANEDALQNFKECFNIEKDDDIDCYWRKQWSFRDEVINYLNNKYNTNEDTYSWALDLDDLKKIEQIQLNYLNQQYWDDQEASQWNPWTYDEYIMSMAHNLQRIVRLEMWMQDNESDIKKLAFYDSY